MINLKNANYDQIKSKLQQTQAEKKTRVVDENNLCFLYNLLNTNDKIELSHTAINLVFNSRYKELKNLLNINSEINNHIETRYFKTNNTETPDILTGHCLYFSNDSGTIEISYFGVKDTLKPISEFINEIKGSKKYLEYINQTN